MFPAQFMQYLTVGVVLSAAVFAMLKLFKKTSKKLLKAGAQGTHALKLIEKTSISHDTRMFRFALPSNDMTLGLPIGQHISLHTTINGEPVQRSYTPCADGIGYFDLVIKVYFKNVHPKFPDGGKLTQYLESVQVGDSVLVGAAPRGLFDYKGHGHFRRGKNEYHATKFAMVAGGTGLTPMFQVVQAILKDPSDKTECSLLYANQTEDDILLRGELEKMARESNGRFKISYTLDRPGESWQGLSGFVTEDMLKATMPVAGSSTFALMCGPPPMVKFALKPNFEKLQYPDTNVFAF